MANDSTHKTILLPDKAEKLILKCFKFDLADKVSEERRKKTVKNLKTEVLSIGLCENLRSKKTMWLMKWILTMHPNINTLFI